jgi:alpha-L-fucosidase
VVHEEEDSSALYVVAAFPPKNAWKRGEWKEFVLKSVKATANTTAGVLGQNDLVYEYSEVVPKTTWKQEADGLHVRAFFAQRLQDNSAWPNPVVLKLTGVEPALVPPGVDMKVFSHGAGHAAGGQGADAGRFEVARCGVRVPFVEGVGCE